MRSDMKYKIEDEFVEFERALTRFLTPEHRKDDPVWLAARYSTLSGGKRVRPRLLFMTCRLFSDNLPPETMAFAAAIEMIHTYSLIHDDLPAMDDDDFRRGQPACHRQFGEATAILAGDLLLNRAFETASASCIESGRPEAISAFWWMATMAGGEGMILGQSLDLAMDGRHREGEMRRYTSSATVSEKDDITSIELVREMVALKTGCLIRAAVGAGARLSGASSDDMTRLDQFASSLGLLFQIRDDILDVISDREMLGKTIGKDARDQKKTYVTVLGEEQARQALDEVTRDAEEVLDALEAEGHKTDELRDYTRDLTNRIT
jgi:geranylgeranyl diphosphate synthase type II